MDAQIRRLVVAGTEQNGLSYFFLFYSIFKKIHFNIIDIQLLSDAFNKLQQNFQVNLAQSKDTIGQDIYVLLAESALDVR